MIAQRPLQPPKPKEKSIRVAITGLTIGDSRKLVGKLIDRPLLGFGPRELFVERISWSPSQCNGEFDCTGVLVVAPDNGMVYAEADGDIQSFQVIEPDPFEGIEFTRLTPDA